MGDKSRFPAAYVHYLVEFHATRDYFECHEILEEYWKEHLGDRYAELWVGLIQLAVGSYHHRRNNIAGAGKMFRQCLAKLSSAQEGLQDLGLNGGHLIGLITERITAIERQERFVDFELPLADAALIALCQEECRTNGLEWGAPSSSDEALTNRHTLRDRSDVIAARRASAEAKIRQRKQH